VPSSGFHLNAAKVPIKLGHQEHRVLQAGRAQSAKEGVAAVLWALAGMIGRAWLVSPSSLCGPLRCEFATCDGASLPQRAVGSALRPVQ
jgi:hypothetical protein